jgi:PEP-CTERM motif
MVSRFFATAGLLLVAAFASSAWAAPTYYNDRPTFLAQLGTSVTDPYSDPRYVFIQNNAVMSAVLGETDYVSTGWPNLNIVSNGQYCAGCNGSFRLEFTSTSVGGASGVWGAGFDFPFNSGYFAYITFGDGSTDNVAIPTGNGFFGLTSSESVKSIHLGLTGGGTTQGGNFGIDNLTIGNAGDVPEPSALLLAGLGLAGVAVARRRRSS